MEFDLFEILLNFTHHLMHRCGGGQGVIGHLAFDLGEERLDFFAAEESVAEFFFDHRVHPFDRLLLASATKGTRFLGGFHEFDDDFPEVFERRAFEGRAGDGGCFPSVGGGEEKF